MTIGLREQNKNLRRKAILDAARALILEDQSRDFSMPELAERAGVSLVTPYNLFGTKANILLEIVREDIFQRTDEIAQLPFTSLTGWIAAFAALLARVYYSKRHFYRRMIVTLTALENAEAQRESLSLSYELFAAALARLYAEKKILSLLRPEALAEQLAHAVAGALQRRLMERGSEERLKTDIELAISLPLSGICLPRERAALHKRMKGLSS